MIIFIRVFKKWKGANNGGILKVIWNKHIWLKMFQELPVSGPWSCNWFMEILSRHMGPRRQHGHFFSIFRNAFPRIASNTDICLSTPYIYHHQCLYSYQIHQVDKWERVYPSSAISLWTSCEMIRIRLEILPQMSYWKSDVLHSAQISSINLSNYQPFILKVEILDFCTHSKK